jgi:hypothetical protein
MPIKKIGNKAIEISDIEAMQLRDLHKKIKNKEPIEQLIKEINPNYLLDIVNFPRPYTTRKAMGIRSCLFPSIERCCIC